MSIIICSVQSAEVKQLFAEAEGLRTLVKSKDEKMCIKETQLEEARNESELISGKLKRAKQKLANEMSKCKACETQMNKVDQGGLQSQNGETEPELEELREQHRQHMNAIQTLWIEQEGRKEEFVAHKLILDPRQWHFAEMKKEFAEKREMLVAKLEAVYEQTGRKKQVRFHDNIDSSD